MARWEDDTVSTQRTVGSIGSSVTGQSELEQSLRLLITVRKGSIPHRPDLGSPLFELIDEPADVVASKALLYVAQAVAADQRLVVDSVELVFFEPGQLELEVTWHPAGSSSPVSTRVTVA